MLNQLASSIAASSTGSTTIYGSSEPTGSTASYGLGGTTRAYDGSAPASRSSALALSSFVVGFAAFPGTFIAESTTTSTERAGSRSSIQATEEIAGSTTGSIATSAASRTGLEMTG
ncbi:hypothetical protein SUGI_0192060 [Cryptomeria japonica]|nr:hypothetical protein SUGI_0192060 [Cryptomeria japonica]